MSAPARIWSRDFLLLWQGSVVSALGGQAFDIALVLWTKAATESGTMVGAVMFAAGITSLVMPVGGALADSMPRVRLLVILDAFSGVCVLLLAGCLFWLPAGHPLLLPAVLTATFFRSVGTSLFHPVATALVPDLVPVESLNRANSTLQSSVQCTIVIGKSLGGLLYRVLGVPVLLLVDAISFLLSAFSESFIREPERTQDRPARRFDLRGDLRDGFRYTGRIPGFRLYMLEAAAANFCVASLFVCLPFYVEDVLRLSGDWYGYLLAGMGLGAMLGGILAAWFPRPGVTRGSVQLVAMTVLNGCMLPLSLVRSPWAAVGIMFVAWASAGFHGVILTTLLQHRTPAEIRGRVFGLLTMIRIGLIPLGMTVFGVLIDQPWAGPVRVLFWTGVAGLAILAVALLFPNFRWFFTGDEREVPIHEPTD